LNNFFRRNCKPLIFYPGIPPIFLIPFVPGLYLKFRLYGVGYPLKPMLVRSVRPFAARKKFG